jgi:hypothetical protein
VETRHLAVLRLLGRLEFVQTPIIARLLYRGASLRTAQRELQYLAAEHLIWSTTVSWGTLPAPTRTGTTTPPPKPPLVWGLTTAGRTLLASLGAEHDEQALQGLRCRDPRGKPVPQITLRHDLQASWWCAAVLCDIQRSPWCHSVFVQVEFVSHERQRIDALVVLRINPTTPRPEVGTIPWFDGTPKRPDEIEVRLALEIDRGTEQLTTLLEKGICYRDLHAQGVYSTLVGGPVLPVFVVPTMRRAGQIATEWQDAWPDGWGVIAPLDRADHPEHGPLWGTYKSMRKAQSGQKTPLLTAIQVGSGGTVTFQPVMALEQWLQGKAW